jgi:TIR domain
VSRHSLESRWVKEELSTAKVLQVEGRCRLIPVIIDDIEDQLPVMLKSTLWQRIGDLDDYDEELRRIRDSIYNRRESPTLGDPPGYVRAITDTLPGLSHRYLGA